MNRPGSLEELWSERDLAERFGLRIGTGGRCLVIGHWIRGGLVHIEKAGRRFFWEQDVIGFFLRAREGAKEDP